MGYRLVADAVVVVHLAFIVFVGAGALLAWRWPRLVWLHVPAVVYAVAIVTVGFDCPLTPIEKHFRGLAGEGGYEGGFVDRYVEGVIYPESATTLLRAVAAVAVVAGYAGLVARRRARADRRVDTPAGAGTDGTVTSGR